MADYRLTKKAVEDLNSIWDYTYTQWSESQADKYYNLLIHNFEIIAANPQIGRSYEFISDGLHGFKVSHHIIFYTYKVEKSIKIVRILHE